MNTESALKEIQLSLATLIEVNESLVKQNIKLSEQLYGQVKLPQEHNEPSKKELYYCQLDELYNVIHGPGTYDNKPTIKTLTNAEWDKSLKAWKVTSPLQDITEKFPDISFKQI
jgi:hypothetical protein